MRKSSFVPAILILILVALVVSGCQTKSPAPVSTPGPGTAQPNSGPVKTSDRIVSEGSVVPVQYTYLSFPAQGVLDEVLASEGQLVKKDDVIARLKGSARIEASIAASNAEVLSAQQALDDLNKNADVAKSAAQLKLAQANKDLDKAKTDRESKAYKHADQSVIDNARAQMLLAEDAYKTAQDVFSQFEGKDENDLNRAAVLTQLSRARQEYERAKANFNYANGYPDQFDLAIADGKLSLAQASYDQALRDWNKVKDGPDPELLSLTEARLANAKAQLEASQSALDDQQLKAPFSGTIVSSDLKVGQLIGSQTSPVVLADLENYEVKTTDLTELNVVDVTPGASVKLTFDAIPDLELSGKVERIKTLGEDKQGDVTYTVYIKLDKQDPRLRWNMTSSVVFEGK